MPIPEEVLPEKPPSSPRVLLVEDSAFQAKVALAKLRAAWGEARIVHATDLASTSALLTSADNAFDCVLLDLGLPDSDGLESVKRVRAEAPGTAIVVLSGDEDEQLALVAVREGAQDYLVKGQVGHDQIVRSITYAIERKRQEARLVHQALHDGLTDLPNRVQFASRLEIAITRLQRDPQPVALLFCDLDSFKPINDRFGHGAGDTVLIEVARRLVDVVRDDDFVARLGGDEFVILCERTSTDDACEIASRTREAVAAPIDIGEDSVTVGISIGIAIARGSDTCPSVLLRDADAAMYREKSASGAAR